MPLLGIFFILILAYFNFRNEVSLFQIIYFLVGSAITFNGFVKLADPQSLLMAIGLIAIGLIVMKPPLIFKRNP
jgi:uncharacterized membrane protein